MRNRASCSAVAKQREISLSSSSHAAFTQFDDSLIIEVSHTGTHSTLKETE